MNCRNGEGLPEFPYRHILDPGASRAYLPGAGKTSEIPSGHGDERPEIRRKIGLIRRLRKKLPRSSRGNMR